MLSFFIRVMKSETENTPEGTSGVWASDDEAQTLKIVLGDDIAGVEVHLLYGVLEACDVISKCAH